MTSSDFRSFVDSLIGAHQAWLTAHPSPDGTEFLQHHVGDAAHPNGMLWQGIQWRAEHGYHKWRSWNGSETLGRPTAAEIPSPGLVVPWNPIASAGPALDSRLAATRTTGQLQADFGGTGAVAVAALGVAIRDHWEAVRTWPTPLDSEIHHQPTAPYSLRYWCFMRWAEVMRSRLLGIPVFGLPIPYDPDGVPLSDIEFLDAYNRYHNFWHTGSPPATQTTDVATGNPFAPRHSPLGQPAGRGGFPGEFLWFHRELLDTYDSWRRRQGMPPVSRFRPDALHFHPTTVNGTSLPELDVPVDAAGELAAIKDRSRHFYTLSELAGYMEGSIHGSGHTAPGNEDIADIYSNNYSPRFFGWHRWIDYVWEVRQPRFDALDVVTSDGTEDANVITVVRPAPAPDRIEPNNALTGVTGDGRGSLWVAYTVRPETWGRAVNLSITAKVYRDSDDIAEVAALAATPVAVNAVAQGVASGPIELAFPGLDADGEGAFARKATGTAIGFKNGRIRLTATLTPVGPIPGSVASGTDEITYETIRDVVLVKDTLPPVAGAILNRGAFSVDEVTVNASGATSTFAEAFLVTVQDPPVPPPALGTTSIFSDPARTAVSGVFADTAIPPTVAVVDEMGNEVSWFAVALTGAFPEQPGIAAHISQRVLFPYLAIFQPATLAALLPNAGDKRYARLRISARDRAGNVVSNVYSQPIKLFRDANPYMIDVKGDNPSWLSVDTRVFKVKAPQTKFGHSVAAAGSPQQYIQAVLTEFNNGTQNFDTIPAGEDQALLELAPLEDGVAVHNFALARVRMRTTSQIDHVRVMFRLFTTAVTNLSFTPENYPSTTGTDPAALLGRTAAGEIVSIPFFADTRVETRNIAGGVSMETQPDGTNERSFPPSVGSAESIRYFGAYLDINADTPRYPQHPAGNGPYPSGECVSIRNILRGQHECMVAEVMYAGDPTEPNVFPATSDNLAQRNLFIIEAANPGTDGSRTVQHSFDLVLGGQRERTAAQEITRLAALTERAQANPDTVPGKVPELTREARATVVPGIADNAGPFDRVPDNVADRVATRRSVAALWNEWAAREPAPKTGGGTVAFMSDAARRATIDELAIFWHDVPSGAEVEIYMPGYPVDYVAWLRDLRHAPATVRVIDDRTLALTPQPGGVTYLPFAPFQPGRFAGLVTIKLPKGIVAGTKYTVDFIHLRPLLGVTVGAFRMVIPVRKAQQIVDYEARLIDVFTERLATTPADNRWHPILVRQLAYLHDRVHALAKEALEECREEKGHPGEKHRKVRIVLDRIKVLDPNGPLVGGSGKLLLTARVQTLTNGGTVVERRVPAVGEYAIAGAAGGDLIEVKMEIFRGEPDPATTIEIWGGEGKQHCHYRRTIFTQGGDRSYAPSDEPHDSENIGDWQLWYHVEQIA